jgi:signal peptidase II
MAMKAARLLYSTALIVLVLDVVSKVLIRTSLDIRESVSVFPFVSITHVQNVGIAFGLLQLPMIRWLLVAIALAVAALVAWSCKERKLKEHFLAWGLIMGGALGNATDRIFIGTVTDFIDIGFWPAFNVADSALTIGVLLLVWHAMRKE